MFAPSQKPPLARQRFEGVADPFLAFTKLYRQPGRRGAQPDGAGVADVDAGGEHGYCTDAGS